MILSSHIADLLCEIKKKNPLIHHITNYVTANDCANITLAAGASPVMADDIHEVRAMVALASSLVLNIGTINNLRAESMLEAGKKANELGIPVILDPVGAGATQYRTELARHLIDTLKFTAIRGNLSEIKTLNGIKVQTRGVDSAEPTLLAKGNLEEEKELAKSLAKKLKAIVAITGEVDIITDGELTYTVKNGHSMMSRVTGTGCMCTSLIGAYLGAGCNSLIAVVSAVATMGIAGELAYEKLDKHLGGPGHLKINILDVIFNLTEEEISKRLKVNEG